MLVRVHMNCKEMYELFLERPTAVSFHIPVLWKNVTLSLVYKNGIKGLQGGAIPAGKVSIECFFCFVP